MSPFAEQVLPYDPLSQVIVDVGQVVGGGAAIGGVAGYFLAGVYSLTTRRQADPLQWAATGAQLGAVAGVTSLIAPYL